MALKVPCMNDGHTHDKVHNRNAAESETIGLHLTRSCFSCWRLTLRVGDVPGARATNVCRAPPRALWCPGSSAEPVLFSLPVQGKRPMEEFEF